MTLNELQELCAKIADKHGGFQSVKRGTHFDQVNRGRNHAAANIARDIRAIKLPIEVT